MLRPGPLNAITDVPGILVGQAEAPELVTGTTVILPARPCVAAVDHRGGGIGARDTVLLGPGSTVDRVHAICLSGGSAYGLDAAGGVMAGLRARGVGFAIGPEIVPIVPSAIIFDLLTGGPKTWPDDLYLRLGRQALEAAGCEVRLGNAGAGLGAKAGRLKGGVGTASYAAEWTVGALAVANPVGDTVIPGTSTFWAWYLEAEGELGGQTPPGTIGDLHGVPEGRPLANTTLAVVATDATLSRDEAQRVAVMAQDGLARAIRPVHAPLDGDTVFVLSTGTASTPSTPAEITRIGTLAADAVARSIMRAVFHAQSLAGYPSFRDGER